jgi:hypothetical protein
MPESSPLPPPELTKPDQTDPLIYELAFWCCAWLGATIAGSFYAGYCGVSGSSLAGFFLGFAFAGMTAFPILLTAAVITWALWLSRFRLIMATLAGAIIGLASAKMPSMNNFSDMTWIFGRVGSSDIVPVFFVAVACPLSSFFCCRKLRPRLEGQSENGQRWQFSLRDLFVHFTILAVFISLWTWLFTFCHSLERQNQQPQQRSQAAGRIVRDLRAERNGLHIIWSGSTSTIHGTSSGVFRSAILLLTPTHFPRRLHRHGGAQQIHSERPQYFDGFGGRISASDVALRGKQHGISVAAEEASFRSL